MADIRVEAGDGDAYVVTVSEDGGSTRHEVTVAAVDAARLGGDTPPADLLAASFRFLLEREPKESILRRFDLTEIERYFPDYPSSIARYL